MAENPWHVDSILAFSYYKCPECVFESKEDYIFEDHALENHPLSFALFGKYVKKEESKDDSPIEELKTDNNENSFSDDGLGKNHRSTRFDNYQCGLA